MTKIFVNNRDMTKQRRPTEGELAILKVLWTHGPLTVRDIQRVLNGDEPTGYTTVLKLLQIMTEKELVSRDQEVRVPYTVAGAIASVSALSTQES